MVFQNMRVHAPGCEVKDSAGGEDENASLPIFGERRGDISRDGAEFIQQLDGLGATMDCDSLMPSWVAAQIVPLASSNKPRMRS